MIRAVLIVVVIVAGLMLLFLLPFLDLLQEPRPEPESPSIYTALGRAFVTPLLAWVRVCHPTSSVAVRFTPLKRCSGAFVVRP